jgi:hypothetical protein
MLVPEGPLPALSGVDLRVAREAISSDATVPYVVGIGASAGGLEALERFFDNVPADSGMAFVVVQHLSPDFKSLMDEILARRTELPIRLVEDAMVVEANHIYLIPPKKEMIISGGRLLLSERDREQELTLPIDVFFRWRARANRAKPPGKPCRAWTPSTACSSGSSASTSPTTSRAPSRAASKGACSSRTSTTSTPT